jgi:hypothetical protein
MDNQEPRVTEKALFDAAIDEAYPIPDSPHTSVMQRANDSRAAFARGWQARQAAPEAPTGYKLVPLVANKDMLHAGMRYFHDKREPATKAWEAYRDMIAAAPATQQADAPDELLAVPDDKLDDHLRSIGMDPAECEAMGRRALDGALKAAATTASASEPSDGEIYEAVSRRADPEGHAEAMAQMDEVLGRVPSKEAQAAHAGAVSEAFADWLKREMPPGTVISDPAWWAPRILRAAIATSEQKEPQA